MTDLTERNFIYPSPEESEVLTLYKYLTSTALTGFLSNGCLKLSFGFDANDPFELLTAGDIPDSAKYVDEGFISFTKKDNDPHMWGVYADKYRGACLEFQFLYYKTKADTPETQHEYVWRHFKDEDGDEKHYNNGGDVIFECNYTPKRPKSALFGTRPHTMEEINNWIRMCRTSKHASWKDEEEYRMLFSLKCNEVIKASEDQSLYLIPGLAPSLKSITLGPRCNIPLSYIEYCLRQNQILAPDQTITYGKASFQKGSYDLIVDSEVSTFPSENEH